MIFYSNHQYLQKSFSILEVVAVLNERDPSVHTNQGAIVVEGSPPLRNSLVCLHTQRIGPVSCMHAKMHTGMRCAGAAIAACTDEKV